MLVTWHLEASILISGTFSCVLKADVKLLRGRVDHRRWPRIGMREDQFQRFKNDIRDGDRA